MPLAERLRDDMKSAMKSGDSFSLGILRMLSAVLQNKGIENRGKGLKEELTDGEIQAVLQKEMKKRQDAAALYEQGGRVDLAQQEKKEAEFIKKYLPAQMSREDIEKVAKAKKEALGITDKKDMGRLMGEVMKELKNQADGKVVREVINALLP